MRRFLLALVLVAGLVGVVAVTKPAHTAFAYTTCTPTNFNVAGPIELNNNPTTGGSLRTPLAYCQGLNYTFSYKLCAVSVQAGYNFDGWYTFRESYDHQKYSVHWFNNRVEIRRNYLDSGGVAHMDVLVSTPSSDYLGPYPVCHTEELVMQGFTFTLYNMDNPASPVLRATATDNMQLYPEGPKILLYASGGTHDCWMANVGTVTG